MTARGRRHLEEVDDERASIAQVVHHLVVIDVVVHWVAELETETEIETLGMVGWICVEIRCLDERFTLFCDCVYWAYELCSHKQTHCWYGSVFAEMSFWL